MKNYLALTKPRITALILVCTGTGFYFGQHGSWTLLTLFHTLMGTALMASGTAALNQWLERDADGKMRRTRGRPIPAGQIPAVNALVFGIGVSAAGFFELGWGANSLTAGLGLLTLLSYLFLYTPLKQRSPICTAVGAIPGAMPPLIGYAGASGLLTWDALALFAILFIWQFPHFYAIAWMYREDYARGGIRMLPVVKPDGAAARQIVIGSLLLIPVSLIPRFLGMAGAIYFTGASILGLGFLYFATRASLDLSNPRARTVLLASVTYLPALLALMVLDRVPL